MNRGDWAVAAVDLIAESGIAGVAIEALAGRLGATKGSFYWHFRDRDELIRTALDHWEESATDAHIRNMLAIDDPHARFAYIRKVEADPKARFNAKVEAELLAAADHPTVRPVVARVMQRRVDFMHSVFAGMGFDERDARDRALMSVASFAGRMALKRAAPKLFPTRAKLQGHLDRTGRLLEEESP